MITLQTLRDIYNDNKVITEEEHKILLSLIFSKQYKAIVFEREIFYYVDNILSNYDWYHDFVCELILSNKISYFDEDISVINFFSHTLKIQNKETFIQIIKKTKCFYLFKNNFYKNDYTEFEKEEIRKLFNFSEDTIYCFDINYGLKREIFDYFGIIPSLLSLSSIHRRNSDVNLNYDNQQQLRLLIKHFKFLNLQEQTKLCIKTFFEHYFLNEYLDIEKEDYKNFYMQLIQENNTIIDYLQTKEKSDIELAFLNFALPIKEEVNNFNNIQSF